MFVKDSCRGSIFKVSLEGRLREMCTALAENLSDCDLYKMHPPLNSFAGAHLMQGCIGQPSQQIRASSSYTNPAPVNKNMLHRQMAGVKG
ncbi:hypothetical protein V6N11_077320 [Hibiscus sabdariffa]|uniref:Uncharacterized protein n=1 Tax=Hibiscus sabdariffa TaxID=183260 RepID=A0ABR2TDI6_9ROSI